MIDLEKYGYIEAETPPIGLIPGRVTELKRDQYTVITEQGEVTAVLKGTFYHTVGTREDFPCVGDFVFLQYNENGASLIAKLLPRRSKFSRADYSGHAAGYVKTILEQVVATNFDYVIYRVVPKLGGRGKSRLPCDIRVKTEDTRNEQQ